MEYWSTGLAESLLLLDWRSPVSEFCVKELMVPLSEYATVSAKIEALLHTGNFEPLEKVVRS
jgi:hypothetical protein